MKTRPPADTVEVILETTDPDLSWTWSYILTALDIPHHILTEDDVFHLLVPAEFTSLALREITGYLAESRDRLPVLSPPEQERTGIQPPTLLLIGSLFLFYTITGPWNGNSIWFQAGAGNSQAILQQYEWYRLITALTLHANGLHLLSNCILGGFLLHYFFLLTGTGLGLFALLVAATSGNLINVLLHGPDHLFVGFSTAIFAVIGMLSMLSYKDKSRPIASQTLVPLMASAALLAMLGSSGERTDLGAHLFGLLCGLLMGKILCLPLIKMLRPSFIFQLVLFSASLLIFAISWILALRR
jgi:rhomboid protease GluP